MRFYRITHYLPFVVYHKRHPRRKEDHKETHAPRRRRRRLSRTERGRESDVVFFCVCEPSPPRVEREKDRTDDDDDDADAGTQLENVVRARRGFRGVDVDVGVFRNRAADVSDVRTSSSRALRHLRRVTRCRDEQNVCTQNDERSVCVLPKYREERECLENVKNFTSRIRRDYRAEKPARVDCFSDFLSKRRGSGVSERVVTDAVRRRGRFGLAAVRGRRDA